jgi:hypothetical protein
MYSLKANNPSTRKKKKEITFYKFILQKLIIFSLYFKLGLFTLKLKKHLLISLSVNLKGNKLHLVLKKKHFLLYASILFISR